MLFKSFAAAAAVAAVGALALAPVVASARSGGPAITNKSSPNLGSVKTVKPFLDPKAGKLARCHPRHERGPNGQHTVKYYCS
ncbi:MAG: hypothetical protein FJX62_16880 [Alphaproteobacteria bacterium]|nr:hypothetical protein [Alphaproteobacteria bacterium]